MRLLTAGFVHACSGHVPAGRPQRRGVGEERAHLLARHRRHHRRGCAHLSNFRKPLITSYQILSLGFTIRVMHCACIASACHHVLAWHWCHHDARPLTYLFRTPVHQQEQKALASLAMHALSQHPVCLPNRPACHAAIYNLISLQCWPSPCCAGGLPVALALCCAAQQLRVDQGIKGAVLFGMPAQIWGSRQEEGSGGGGAGVSAVEKRWRSPNPLQKP